MSSKQTGIFLGASETVDRGKDNRKFLTRDFYIDLTDNAEYPNTPKFQLLKDKTTLVDGLNKGDEITVYYNLSGKKYDGKVYTNLIAWKIEHGPVSPATAFPGAADEPQGNTEADDLPFLNE